MEIEDYTERIKKVVQTTRAYEDMFPMLASMRGKEDIRNFMSGYIEAMVPFVSREHTERDLASDNLGMLHNIYHANTGKKIKFWDAIREEIFSKVEA